MASYQACSPAGLTWKQPKTSKDSGSMRLVNRNCVMKETAISVYMETSMDSVRKGNNWLFFSSSYLGIMTEGGMLLAFSVS